MATSRSKAATKPRKGGRKKPVRFVKAGSTSSKNGASSTNGKKTSRTSAPRKATTKKAPGRKSVESTKSTRAVKYQESPAWKDLAKANDRPKGPIADSDSYLGALSTARFAAVVLAVATLFTLYVGHVFATQDLLADVQTLRNENLALQMTYDKLEGGFHAKTGPEAIIAQAEKLGLSERLPTGTPIVVN